MENNILWHYKHPNTEQEKLALKELKKMRDNFLKRPSIMQRKIQILLY